MRLFGFDITRAKASPQSYLPVSSDSGWFRVVSEPFTGAWQRNIEWRRETVTTFHAVYACVTLIAQDISKLRLRLVERDANGIWDEKDVPAFTPVLRKPNRFQNRIKFIEQWVVSKLLHGNTYILLGRNGANLVDQMFVLDPLRTKPVVTPDGAVFYQLAQDNLAGIEESSVYVPASEIIHDVMVPLFHPLCGVSPLTACGLAAAQGLAIQQNSAKFFQNGSQPSGILTAPGEISDTQAEAFKREWEEKYSGANAGRIAVLGGGLKYEQMAMSATDAQLIEQLKLSAEIVCSAFHVPSYMIGAGVPPNYNNIEALNQQYYTQCLQALIENIELLFDEALGLTRTPGHVYGTEFDLDDLLRMDSKTMSETEKNLSGIKKLDEMRKRFNLPPVKGGDAVYLQQQNYSSEALAKRDAQADPFASKVPAALPAPKPADGDDDVDSEDVEATAQMAAWSLKSHLGLSV